MRGIGSKPPSDWDEARRKECFAWVEAVVAGCRGVNSGLEDSLALERVRVETGHDGTGFDLNPTEIIVSGYCFRT